MEREKEKNEVAAVYEDDLLDFFTKFNLREKFQNKELTCKFCKIAVGPENIYSILPESGTINVVCDKSECVAKLLIHLEEKKNK